MRAEVIALGLQQVRRQPRLAIAVVVGERRAEGWRGDAVFDGGADGDAPVRLGAGDDVGEERIENEVFQPGVLLVGVGDAVEESGANDAAAAPDAGDVLEVEVPIVEFAGGSELDHALGVAHDFRGVERVADGVDQSRAISGERSWSRTWKLRAGGDAFVFQRAENAGFDGTADDGKRDAHLGGVTDGPFAGAFLPGLVEDEIDDRGAGFRVAFGENVRRNLD